MGRTHGIHAEPITFGMKLGMWAFEVSRHLKRMRMVTVNASVGKISGAVGAYNNIDPRVEDLVCEELGIGREPISNQVVQRDRHAAFLSCIAIIGSSLEKFATEVRHLQRTEVREAEEAFGKGQKGSSAMPHKRNPILSERMAGCARVLRGNAWWAWRTWRCGTSATSATAPPSASSSPTAASSSTTCCRSSPS